MRASSAILTDDHLRSWPTACQLAGGAGVFGLTTPAGPGFPPITGGVPSQGRVSWTLGLNETRIREHWPQNVRLQTLGPGLFLLWGVAVPASARPSPAHTEPLPAGGTSLKEPVLSRGSWRFFVRTPSAEAGWGFFELRVGLSSRTRGMRVGVVTVFFFEVVEPFFSRSSRLHPNTSLREYVCRIRQSPRPQAGTWHRGFSATVSHCKAVSIRLTLRSKAESKWHLRLARQARASSPARKSRCNPNSLLPTLVFFVFPRVPGSPFRLRRRLGPHPGEAHGDEATAKVEGADPFCRARAEVYLAPAWARSFCRGGPPTT
jgi:hypothetical protein